ncbi:MAG TPA: ferredoxin family protein [Dehalococcoidia bacterium]|nr:ferredoxin family protein [Dehalococcoidia bacterium]
MTFVITQPCIDEQDQSCVEVCPVDCIQFEEGVDRMLYVDPVECIDCGACQPACPVDAIFPDIEVPDDRTHFVEINALWFQDRAAARAQAEGGAGAAPAAPAAAPAASSDAPADDAPADDAPAAEAETVAEPVHQTQVEALEGDHGGIVVPKYSQPSPVALIASVVLAVSFFAIWMGPDPYFDGFRGLRGPSKLGMVAIVPLLLSLLVLIRSQTRDLGRFAASRPRATGKWRDVTSDWRRSEEMRRHELTRAVQEIARTRFAYPNDDNPGFQTHVNLPEPRMAVEFGGAGKDQAFPDILVVEYPGNYPVMVAQVETRETLTREQAERVWKRLEMKEAPLDVYVPAGLAAQAKDYARAAGMKHVRFRTWTHSPNGVSVREV